jgi:KDO2-lipid IV(A) lauroyltransferase
MRSLSYASLVAAHWLAKRISIERVSFVGSVIGRTLGAGTKRDARAIANLTASMPNITQAERKAIVRGMWDNFGRTVAEALVTDRIAADPARVSLTNPDLLDGCCADGRGTVFVCLHFGNWELSTIPLVRHGHSPLVVYKPLNDSAANAYLLRLREHMHPGGLLPASRATLLRIARHVRVGGSICISGDHRDTNGLSVPFFGRPAPTASLPAMLAVRYGARVIAVRVDRMPNARFSVTLAPIPVLDTGDAAADILATTATIQARLEAWIKADPGRWLWFYKRWDEAGGTEPRNETNSHRAEADGSIAIRNHPTAYAMTPAEPVRA